MHGIKSILLAFANYFREPREPSPRELEALNAAAALAAMERKRAEEHLQRLARARKFAAACNRALIYASDEEQLLRDMCRIAVESGGYPMAWTGLVRHDADFTVEPVATAGDNRGYFSSTRLSWGDNEFGRGPTGMAVRTGRPQAAQEIRTAGGFSPWREKALAHGYQAAATLPLICENQTLGVFGLFSERPNAFDEEEIGLLDEVAHDLAYGINSLRVRAGRKQAEAKLVDTELRFQATFDQAAVGIAHIDREGRIILANRRVCQILGYELHELVGRTIRELSHPDDIDATVVERGKLAAGEITTFSKEKRYLRKDGSPIWVGLTVSLACAADGSPLYEIAVLEDIGERRRAQEELARLAQFDTLTGLPNRNLFQDRLNQAVTLAHREEWLAALLFVDLDNFKEINDTLGHGIGDQLLKAVAEQLRACVREGDTIARLSGDEFTVILEDIRNSEHIDTVAGKILAAFEHPFRIDGRDLFITASIGVAIYPGDGPDAESLLKHADMAMYHAKNEGRNNFQRYASKMGTAASERMVLETSLRQALERKEFVLYYQPVVDLADGTISSAEALLRWQHPKWGLVAPGRFIKVAEQSGLIVPIGKWVLQEACTQVVKWREGGLNSAKVAVNLSARQFRRTDFVDMAIGVLRSAGLDGNLLELEITESLLMENPETSRSVLMKLKATGILIALDDFGTGYSSLSYLKHFPLDIVKIDQSFVRDVTTDPDDAVIVKAMIGLAQNLQLSLTAEGVETAEQLAFLRSHGCDHAQGYLFSHPLPTEEVEALLRSRKTYRLDLRQSSPSIP